MSDVTDDELEAPPNAGEDAFSGDDDSGDDDSLLGEAGEEAKESGNEDNEAEEDHSGHPEWPLAAVAQQQGEGGDCCDEVTEQEEAVDLENRQEVGQGEHETALPLLILVRFRPQTDDGSGGECGDEELEENENNQESGDGDEDPKGKIFKEEHLHREPADRHPLKVPVKVVGLVREELQRAHGFEESGSVPPASESPFFLCDGPCSRDDLLWRHSSEGRRFCRGVYA